MRERAQSGFFSACMQSGIFRLTKAREEPRAGRGNLQLEVQAHFLKACMHEHSQFIIPFEFGRDAFPNNPCTFEFTFFENKDRVNSLLIGNFFGVKGRQLKGPETALLF
jgi:hypothetical protein